MSAISFPGERLQEPNRNRLLSKRGFANAPPPSDLGEKPTLTAQDGTQLVQLRCLTVKLPNCHRSFRST